MTEILAIPAALAALAGGCVWWLHKMMQWTRAQERLAWRAARMLRDTRGSVAAEYALTLASTALIMIASLGITLLAVQAVFVQAELSMQDPPDRPVICGSVC